MERAEPAAQVALADPAMLAALAVLEALRGQEVVALEVQTGSVQEAATEQARYLTPEAAAAVREAGPLVQAMVKGVTILLVVAGALQPLQARRARRAAVVVVVSTISMVAPAALASTWRTAPSALAAVPVATIRAAARTLPAVCAVGAVVGRTTPPAAQAETAASSSPMVRDAPIRAKRAA